jgi:hypothetical protein
MKQRPVTQYKCDFCGKAKYARGAMAKHELHCTMNPDRKCRLCEKGEDAQAPMDTLLALLPNVPADELEVNQEHIEATERGLVALRKATGNCPLCILSALRQKGVAMLVREQFDYKKEHDAFWTIQNEDYSRDGF